jgi:predicted phosphodiesterase
MAYNFKIYLRKLWTIRTVFSKIFVKPPGHVKPLLTNSPISTIQRRAKAAILACSENNICRRRRFSGQTNIGSTARVSAERIRPGNGRQIRAQENLPIRSKNLSSRLTQSFSMRLAVFSDIHGNLEAFQAVLTDAGQSQIDAMVCLGDNIGYGPDPDPVILHIKQRRIASVLGNHELALQNPKYLQWFNPLARTSLEKTLKMLSEDSMHFIRHLQPVIVRCGCRFVHGFPPDSATTYLFQVSDDRLRSTLQAMKERICFIGHTHDLELVDFDGEAVNRSGLFRGPTYLMPERRYIINIGSVGQPRDGNNNAKYVIWDSSSDTLDVRYIPYDIGLVANKIIAAGLPEPHARRLW